MANSTDPFSSEDKEILYLLAERFVRKELSETETSKLLEIVRRHAAAMETLRDNIYVDAMLKEAAAKKKWIRKTRRSKARGKRSLSKEVDFLSLLEYDIANEPYDFSAGGERAATESVKTVSFLRFTAAAIVLGAFLSAAVLWLFFHNDHGSLREEAGLNVVPASAYAPPGSLESTAVREATSSAVALVSKSADVVWQAEGPIHEVGSILSPGWLRIKSGFLRVQFFSGAVAVIEGPAEFMIADANRAYCVAGNVVVDVPSQATGFSINIPQATVVDRGTSFSLDVAKEVSEVHVLKGIVDLEELPSGMEQLHEGEAVRLGSDGIVRKFRSDLSGSRLIDELRQVSMINLAEQIKAWEATSRKIDRDPSSLIHFDMDVFSEADFRLLNKSSEGQKVIGDGIVVGCSKGHGAFVQNQALEFRQLSDRVRIHVPNELYSFSLLMRLRVDSLSQPFHSLLMSEKHGLGGLGWMLCNENAPPGRYFIRLALDETENRPAARYDSPVCFTSEKIGRWVEIAVVVDVERETVSHYIDGSRLAEVPLEHGSATWIGRAELGNRSSTSKAVYPVRNFIGSIDDFVLYGRALSEHDIRHIHGMNPISAPPPRYEETTP